MFIRLPNLSSNWKTKQKGSCWVENPFCSGFSRLGGHGAIQLFPQLFAACFPPPLPKTTKKGRKGASSPPPPPTSVWLHNNGNIWFWTLCVRSKTTKTLSCQKQPCHAKGTGAGSGCCARSASGSERGRAELLDQSMSTAITLSEQPATGHKTWASPPESPSVCAVHLTVSSCYEGQGSI